MTVEAASRFKRERVMLEASPTGSQVVFTIPMELLVGTGARSLEGQFSEPSCAAFTISFGRNGRTEHPLGMPRANSVTSGEGTNARVSRARLVVQVAKGRNDVAALRSPVVPDTLGWLWELIRRRIGMPPLSTQPGPDLNVRIYRRRPF